MADEKVKKEGRVIVIDPNAENNGLIPNEDLFIYAKLYAERRSRSIITIEENDGNQRISEIDSRKESKTNFLSGSEQDGSQYLTTNWTNMSGSNEEGIDEAFGIESINIKITPSLVPQVDIEFKDARAAALFDAIERERHSSKYDVFFHMPYPTFYLKVKGHYGKDITLPLHLTKFNTSFEDTTGSFKISTNFIGQTFAFFADIQLGHVMGLVRTKKGKQYLSNVYDEMDSVVRKRQRDNNQPEIGIPQDKRLSLRELNTKIGEVQRRLEDLKSTAIKNSNYDGLIKDRNVVYEIVNAIGRPKPKNESSELSGNLNGNVIKNITKQLPVRDIVFFQDTDSNKSTIKKVNEFITTHSPRPSQNIEYKKVSNQDYYGYLKTLDHEGTYSEGYEKINDSKSDDEFKKSYSSTTKSIGSSFLVTKKSFMQTRKTYSDLLKDIDEGIEKIEKEISDAVNERFDDDPGIKFTVNDVIVIICANIEAFMLYIYETSVAAESTSGRKSELGDLKFTDIPDNGDKTTIYPFPEVYEKVVQKGTTKHENIYLGKKVKNKDAFPELQLVEDAFNGLLNDNIEDREEEFIHNIIKNKSTDGNPQPVSTKEYLGSYNNVTSSSSPYNGFVDNMWLKLVERVMVAKGISNLKYFNAEGDAFNVIQKVKKSPKITKLLKESIISGDVVKDTLDKIISNGGVNQVGNNITKPISDIKILSSFDDDTIDIDYEGGIVSRKVTDADFDYYETVKKEFNQDLSKSNYIPFKKIKHTNVFNKTIEELKALYGGGTYNINKFTGSATEQDNAFNFINTLKGQIKEPKTVFPNKLSIIEIPKSYVLFIGANLFSQTNTSLNQKYVDQIKNLDLQGKFIEYFLRWAIDFKTNAKTRFFDETSITDKLDSSKIKSFLEDTIRIVIHDPSAFKLTTKPTNVVMLRSELEKHMSSFVNILSNADNLSIYDVQAMEDESFKKESAVKDDELKLAVYNHFKNLYDKWLGGSDTGNSTRGKVFNLGSKNRKHLNEYFHVVDRMWRKIGDDAVFNVLEFSNLTKRKTSNMLNFISDVMRESGFVSQMLPFYPDLTFEGAKEMWQPHTYLTNDSGDPVWLCVYAKDESKTLDMYGSDKKLNKKTQYVNDGYNFNDKSSLDIISASEDGENMLAFKVAFGQQNQSIFKGFNVSTTQYSETEESLRIMGELFDRRSGNQRLYKGGDLFPIHRIRGYHTKVTSMGNMMISPMMYFNLENVPFFHGAYYILDVEHRITPNTMETTFTGVRQRSYSAPVPKELTTYIKLDFKTYKSHKDKVSLKLQNPSLDIDTKISDIISGAKYDPNEYTTYDGTSTTSMAPVIKRFTELRTELSKNIPGLTYEMVVATSGYRDEWNQARVVYENWKNKGGLSYLKGLYRSKPRMMEEIDAAYRSSTDKNKAIYAATKVLEHYKKDGKYMSSHQVINAVDIRTTKYDDDIVKWCTNSKKAVICTHAVDETDHIHIRLKP